MNYNCNYTKGKCIRHENQIQIYWEKNIQHRVTREISQIGDFSSVWDLANEKLMNTLVPECSMDRMYQVHRPQEME